MEINKAANERAVKSLNSLDGLSTTQLQKLCNVLGVPTRRRGKGGVWSSITKTDLQEAIRGAVGRGPSTDRLNRFADLIESFIAGD